MTSSASAALASPVVREQTRDLMRSPRRTTLETFGLDPPSVCWGGRASGSRTFSCASETSEEAGGPRSASSAREKRSGDWRSDHPIGIVPTDTPFTRTFADPENVGWNPSRQFPPETTKSVRVI